jgi:hypothetical protein
VERRLEGLWKDNQIAKPQKGTANCFSSGGGGGGEEEEEEEDSKKVQTIRHPPKYCRY